MKKSTVYTGVICHDSDDDKVMILNQSPKIVSPKSSTPHYSRFEVN